MDEGADLTVKFKEFEKDTLAHFVAYDLQIAALVQAIDDIRLKIQKLDEVYYHVFPDRLRKDVQFEQQLRALNSPPDTDPSDNRS